MTSRLVREVVEASELGWAYRVYRHSWRSDKTGSLQGNRKGKGKKGKKEKEEEKAFTAYQTGALAQAQKSENLRYFTGRPAGFGPRIAAL